MHGTAETVKTIPDYMKFSENNTPQTSKTKAP